MTRVKKHIPEMLLEALTLERDLMNIALLPAAYIAIAFAGLKNRLIASPALEKIMGPFFAYFESQWLQKVGVAKFCVYRQLLRTNNTVERYHRRLKGLTATRPEIGKFLSQFSHNSYCVV